ncbi:MAG: TetR/AcrR family transcriptional regulator [Alteromonadaceae bacterium]|nr:TetR/AcrR family transcriptional regulator [Alteromonadaceae bacterium]
MSEQQTDVTNISDLVDLNSARGRLQQAAAKLFKEKGYSQTTVRDIAAAVGIQSGSIFHHFKNKEQILKTVIIDAILRVLSSMEEALSSTNNVDEQLESLVFCELQAIHNEQLDGFKLMMSEWRSLSEANQKEILTLREQYEEIWLGILASAYQAKRVKVESFYLRGFIRGALIETSNWYKVSGCLSLKQLAHMMMTAFISQK